jgi:arginase
MRLADGANAIMGDLPSSRTTFVEVPLGAGEALGTGIARLSALQIVRERVADVLRQLPGDPADLAAPDPTVLIGGDCGIELAGVEHVLKTAQAAGAAAPALIWFDANPDLHSPATSPSHAFCGMVARAILGDGTAGLVSHPPLPAGNLILAGLRSVDDAEEEYIQENGVQVITTEALDAADALVAAVELTGATSVYIHIDLDVLDPSVISGLSDPQPFGLELATLVVHVKALLARFTLAGAGIAMFSPESPDAAGSDLPTVLRILSALTSPPVPAPA